VNLRVTTLGLAVIVPAVAMMAILHAFASNAPMWDDWHWAEMIVKSDTGTLHVADLWRQNNVHRPLVPSLLALGLARLGGWDSLREMYVSLSLAILTQLLAYRLLVQTLPRSAVAPAFLLDSLLLFSLAQMDNWFWGFQMAWFLANLCLFGLVLALSSERLGPLHAGLAVAAVLVATFSIAFGLNGLVAGLFLLATRRPFPGRAVLGWVLFGCAVCALYLWHFDLHAPLDEAAKGAASVLRRVAYLVTFLGSPLGRAGGAASSFAFGLVALAGEAAAVVRFAGLLRDNPPEARVRAPWLAIALYSFLGGCMIAAGRTGTSLTEPFLATSSRYVTIGLLTWLALVALAALELPALRARSRAVQLAAACAAAVAVASFALVEVTAYQAFPAYRDYLHGLSSTVRSYRSYDDVTLENRLFPIPVALAIFRVDQSPDPDRIRGLIAQLERLHEGPFLDAR
jgi:hypothetical protein